MDFKIHCQICIVIQPIHSIGYHFSQSSFALIGFVVDELELDELDEDLALDVVTELMEEFKASSVSSKGSSVALLPFK